MEKTIQTMIDNMPEKTGKSLEEWFAVLKTRQFSKFSEAVQFLKEKHGVTHGFANTIVHLSKSDPGQSGDDLVEKQYEGKDNLRPIYALLKKKTGAFGKDVEFAPKKTYVSVRRKKQFAIVQPSTRTRVDLGLNLKGVAPEGILEASGSFNAMCTHRIRLEKPEDVTDKVLQWLHRAYDEAG